MNKVLLTGRMTQDFKTYGNIAKSSVAVKRDYGNSVYFIDVLAFGEKATFCQENIKKGVLVYIEGEWQTNKGKDRKTYHSCVINQIVCLEKLEIIEQEQETIEPAKEFNEEPADDDLPF